MLFSGSCGIGAARIRVSRQAGGQPRPSLAFMRGEKSVSS
ncbi:hypothetical protein GTCCBUS3UF5_13850 [Geobacillus thermoleovorans CCB_US3_UF5]|uniref:Uncharacterized protein n=1 Tax=Geobacillus thermoleovorans CCB_US3_UF5 TaxID=1111068 RepID=A0ABM5MGB8_GEOTH|nr:hypothetical protein GTCCBUS3UF5_13850 [Geobacillus thermoleovorans CCB_US3_UF5]